MSLTHSVLLLLAGCVPERAHSTAPRPAREQPAWATQYRDEPPAEDLRPALIDEFNAMWTALDNRVARASQRIRGASDEIEVLDGAANDIVNLIDGYLFEKERSELNFRGALNSIERGLRSSMEQYLNEVTAAAERARQNVVRLESYADRAEQLAREQGREPPEQPSVFQF